MVYGLDKFKEYFGDYTNHYVFIGGTACDILLNELGAPYRATKDLDIVLIIEDLDGSFGEMFWRFIEDGEYENREKSEGNKQFYRFSKPKKPGYPIMIELFSRRPYCFDLKFQTGLTPIYIDDSILSLSAILIDDNYYDFLLNYRIIIDGYSVIEIEAVILFKIKAWLDMKERQAKGEHVDSRNIKKHKNDIFRLLANVLPSNKIEIGEEIKEDLSLFITMIDKDRPDLVGLGIRGTSFEDIMELLVNIYL